MYHLTNHIKYYLITLLTVLCAKIHVPAQTQQVQVVTKTIEEQFTYKQGMKLQIQGEKANITVRGHEHNQIKLTLKLVSKALTKKTAIAELEYERYIAEIKGNTLNVKNYFVLPAGKGKFEAILSASIELLIPYDMQVNIIAKYGDIELSDLSGLLNVDSRFGKLNFINLNTRGTFKSYFGDLSITGLQGKSTFELNHIKTVISNFSGEVNIKSNLGDVELSQPNQLKSLKVNSIKSDIITNGISANDYQFDLDAQYGEISLPPALGDNGTLTKWKNSNNMLPLFSLKTKFGNIKIQ